MSTLPTSRLPDDEGYWQELEGQIVRDALGPLALYRRSASRWYWPLAERVGWLVAAALAVIVASWFAATSPGTPSHERPEGRTSPLERSVAPADASGVLFGAAQPPDLAALLEQFPPNHHSRVTASPTTNSPEGRSVER